MRTAQGLNKSANPVGRQPLPWDYFRLARYSESIVQPSASVGQPDVTDFQAAPCHQVRLSRAEKRWCKIAAFLPNSQWSLQEMF
jgi:hypothetical protein